MSDCKLRRSGLVKIAITGAVSSHDAALPAGDGVDEWGVCREFPDDSCLALTQSGEICRNLGAADAWTAVKNFLGAETHAFGAKSAVSWGRKKATLARLEKSANNELAAFVRVIAGVNEGSLFLPRGQKPCDREGTRY